MTPTQTMTRAQAIERLQQLKSEGRYVEPLNLAISALASPALRALSPPPPPDHIVDIAVMLENTFADPVSPPPPEPAQDALLEALRAVVGRGYVEANSPMASQDYVSKTAIAKVRKALRDADKSLTDEWL